MTSTKAAVTPGRIEIFRAGTHRAMEGEVTVTREQLAACVAAYDPAKHEAPLVVGHPRMDAPAYGWVEKLSLDGDSLFAVAKDVEPQFAEMVKAGRFRKISAAFWTENSADNPTPGKWALKHVGFLGAAAPVVKGMKPAKFAGGDDGAIDFADPSMVAMQAEFDRQMRRADADAFVEKLIGEGRVLPVFKDGLMNFMESVDDASVMSFAEGGETVTNGRREWFKSFLSRLPPVITFGAFPLPTMAEQPASVRLPDGYSAATDNDDHAGRAEAYARKHGVSFSEAVVRTSSGR